MAAYNIRDKKNGITSSATQTDVVSSEILWQCLFLIKSEFENLSYRVTKTQNGQEALVVYRNDVFGVYGPPIDPITLTLDPLGKCLLTILFKPLQRVSIVNPKSGLIEINSLLAVLRLVEGKGYNFCPGIPEAVLAGKACNRHVILQKVPFKRFQSTNCPVYYQTPLLQQNNSKSPYLSICPRCMQTAKWAHTLPSHPFPNQQQMNGHREPQELFSRDIHPMMSSPNSLRVISVSPLAQGSVFSSNVPPKPQDTEKQTGFIQSKANLDVNGNKNVGSLPLQGNNYESEVKSPSLIDKLQMGTASLRLMLQEKYKKKTLGFPVEDIKIEFDKKQESVKKQLSNICKQCKKQFSSPASLLNHLQRHEGLSGSWKNRLSGARKPYTSRLSSPIVKMMIRGSKAQDAQRGKKKSSLPSQTNLILVLKYLDDLLLTLNGSQSVEGKTPSPGIMIQGEKLETEEQASEARPSLKRTSSGLAAVQTLLEAAKVAGDGFDDVNKADNSFANHENAPGRKRKNVAAVFPIQHPPAEHQPADISNDQDELISSPGKKPRKSPRLATKKSKTKGLNKCKPGSKQTSIKNIENAPSANDPGLLRNLDLLSSVSLKYHSSADNSNAAPVTSQPPQICTSTAAYPMGTGIAYSTSATNGTPATQNLSISNHLLNNTSGGSVVLTQKYHDSNLRNSTNLPPLPPLLFAGNGPGQGYSFNHMVSQQQQVSGQPVPSVSPSILKNLALTSKTPTLSSVDSGLGDDMSSSECGAIDLSKPKQLKVAKTIPQNCEKTFDISALSGLPHNFAQLVSGNDNPREMLQCLMRMSKPANPVAPSKGIQPPESIISNKQSDSNLQARMFASARNYKIDKKIPSIQHVQAVIASTNRTPTNKGGKSAVQGSSQGDEIHCGYKWSGSGGLVKERTQMVRELVPMDVMSNLLNKAVLPTSNAQQVNLNLISSSQPPAPHPPMLLLPSPSSCSPVNKSQDHTPPQIALNLTTTKANRISSPRRPGPGRPRKSAQNLPVPTSPTSPGSTPSSILRSSLLNPLGSSSQPGVGRMSLEAGSGPKSPQKPMNSTFMNIPSPTSMLSSASTTPTPPSNCTISSPSLAAMLRQPASTKHDMNHADAFMNSHRGSPLLISHNSPIHVGNTMLTLPGGVQIKSEPSDNYMHDSSQARIIMSLPVKSELMGQPLHKGDSHMVSDDDSSSTDLIMDFRGDYPAPRYGEDLSMTHIHSVSRTADRNSDNSAVKCEH